MPDLTLANRFGNSVSFNESTKVLSINLNDLSTIVVNGTDLGLNVTSMTSLNKDTFASKILWALILRSQATQAADNNDETVKLYVTNQGKRSVTRNGVNQFGYQLVATAYQTDSLGVNLDPDNLA
jgi:ribosomal protein L28